jgi:hypothetical protein
MIQILILIPVMRRLIHILSDDSSALWELLQWEVHVTDTLFDTTGPAHKRYFSLPLSGHES